ncbi:TetR/AcrR family transcriptional regulator C-terminal domain-containing protein [Leucobacter sp. M11]|uniref:TetR/AcrR family transcriptional regulator C-terminal domain-containing protein n=1 Tax=Leucobacter sp. M11 TaxID=2993565 RepID=UPI002D8054D8|nr:TetR/AcrR family transcriptional regulator C-terminal domain-containing protein [Leucobacter sp. M11]MEB4613514.1 TetR/AcrR family transcriptional regulator C-terminal domain-containing protein [Leucobacter sp. M11]
MTETGRRRAGRPRTAVLTRQRILETGLLVLDERGAEGMGMRDIAARLGVQVSALYNHVSGRSDLIAGIRELVSDRIDVSAFAAQPWPDALRAWARSYRDAFAAHPPTIALLAVTPVIEDSRTGLMYEAVARALGDAGWPEDRVMAIIVSLESFILGSAMDAVAADEMLDPGDREDVPRYRAAYLAGAERLQASGTRPHEDAFAMGLDAFVRGLEAAHAALDA